MSNDPDFFINNQNQRIIEIKLHDSHVRHAEHSTENRPEPGNPLTELTAPRARHMVLVCLCLFDDSCRINFLWRRSRILKEIMAFSVSVVGIKDKNVSFEEKIEHLEGALKKYHDRRYLGQMCLKIQTMMYKIVHPNLYEDGMKKDKDRGCEEWCLYTIEDIEERINDLKEKNQQDEARDRWKALQKKLKLEREHVKLIEVLEDYGDEEYIYLFNPTEKSLLSCSIDEELESYIKELIQMWKTLSNKI